MWDALPQIGTSPKNRTFCFLTHEANPIAAPSNKGSKNQKMSNFLVLSNAFLFSGGTSQCQPRQIPQDPAQAGRGRGKGRRCRVAGQQAAGEEPGGSHKSHK